MHSLNYIPDKPAGQSDFNNACLMQRLNMENFEVDDDKGFFNNQESETYFFKPKDKWLWSQVTTPLSDLRTV